MKSLSDIVEKRQTVRCPVPEQREEGLLSFGKKQFKLQLIDISAGGYGALCVELEGLEVGATGRLQAGEDCFTVRITSIQPVMPTLSEVDGKSCFVVLSQPSSAETTAEPCDVIPAPPSEPLPVVYRLSLCRLGDAVNPHDKSAGHSWAGLSCGLKHTRSVVWGSSVSGTLLAIIVVLFAYLMMQFIASDHLGIKFSDGKRFFSFLDFKASPKVRHDPPMADIRDPEKFSLIKSFAAGAAKTGEGTEGTIYSFPRASKSSTQQESEIQQQPQKIRYNPGPTPLVVPEAAKPQQLTPSPQNRIQELNGASLDSKNNAGNSSNAGNLREANPAGKDNGNPARQNAPELPDRNQK